MQMKTKRLGRSGLGQSSPRSSGEGPLPVCVLTRNPAASTGPSGGSTARGSEIPGSETVRAPGKAQTSPSGSGGCNPLWVSAAPGHGLGGPATSPRAILMPGAFRQPQEMPAGNLRRKEAWACDQGPRLHRGPRARAIGHQIPGSEPESNTGPRKSPRPHWTPPTVSRAQTPCPQGEPLNKTRLDSAPFTPESHQPVQCRAEAKHGP